MGDGTEKSNLTVILVSDLISSETTALTIVICQVNVLTFIRNNYCHEKQNRIILK